MKIMEHAVLRNAVQFISRFAPESPCAEELLYGITRLMSMEEETVSHIMTPAERAQLEDVRAVFDARNIDAALIRSGMTMFLPLVKSEKTAEERSSALKAFLEKEVADITAKDITEKLLSFSLLPVAEAFAQGKDISDVIAFRRSYQKNRAEEGAAPVQTQEERGKAPAPEAEKKEATQADADTDTDTRKVRSFRDLSLYYRKLAGDLLSVVKGQDAAVMRFVQGCFQGDLARGGDGKKQPRAYFFFFGPPGVGKTLLAETAAEKMEIPFHVFNMSEYATPLDVERLIGIASFYKTEKAEDKEGTLIKALKQSARSVIVFDEVEKAHYSVIRLFLQMLGSGTIRDVSKNRDISLQDTIIIFTSNAGRELYEDNDTNLTLLPEKVLIDALRQETDRAGNRTFPEEMCSRIATGNAILFNHISMRHLSEMIQSRFDALASAMQEEYQTALVFDPSVAPLFLYSRGTGIDARIASTRSADFLKSEIYELSRQMVKHQTDEDQLSVIRFDIDWEGVEEDVKRLFFNDSRYEILVLATEETGKRFPASDEKILCHRPAGAKEAFALLKNDLSAIFIDPMTGMRGTQDRTLSIADYDSEGVRFFHDVAEQEMNLPVYILEAGDGFTDVDRRTFIQEGAYRTIAAGNDTDAGAFRRMLLQLLEERYMERESRAFCNRGYVIDFKSRQDVLSDPTQISICFYDLKKRQAIDVDARGVVLSDSERPKETFADVIGAQDAKDELSYFTAFLKNPRKYMSEHKKPPKGILLYGPPGTGKTMLARAMAGESDVAFIQTSASALKNKYVGESERNIRELFRRAKRYAPAIIFIDEIDAIGKPRTGEVFGRSEASMLNALLTEMDGFQVDAAKPVFVLAATNFGAGREADRALSLDEALLRRFDNRIFVDLPNRDERRQYLDRMVKNEHLDGVTNETIANIAERTTGQSLAIIQNVIRLAMRGAARNGRGVNDADMLNALEEYQFGKKRERTADYYREVAVHETGHAYIAALSGEMPSYITIESRGDFGGYMQHASSEETPNYSRQDILWRIRTALAGRAAERVFFGDEKSRNTGASSDLRNATALAFSLLCKYGMKDGQLIALERDEVMKGPLAESYTAQVNDILNEQMEETVRLVEEGRDVIDAIAGELVDESHLTGEAFAALFREHGGKQKA